MTDQGDDDRVGNDDRAGGDDLAGDRLQSREAMTEKGDYEKEGYLLWRRKAMHTDIRTGVQSRRD